MSYPVNPSPWEVWPGYSSAPADFHDESFDFVFRNVTVPVGVQQRGIPLRVDFDADFYFRALQARDNTWALATPSNNDFLMRFTDPTGQYLQQESDLAVSFFSQSVSFAAASGVRVPIFSEVRIPAGSLVLIDLIANNYNPLDVDLYLCGVKRFAIGTQGVGSCPVPGRGY